MTLLFGQILSRSHPIVQRFVIILVLHTHLKANSIGQLQNIKQHYGSSPIMQRLIIILVLHTHLKANSIGQLQNIKQHYD